MSADFIGVTTIYQEYLDRLYWSDNIDHGSLVIRDLSDRLGRHWVGRVGLA